MISIVKTLFHVQPIQKVTWQSMRRHFSTSRSGGSVSPYYILGVDQSATFEEVKKQYYKLGNFLSILFNGKLILFQ